LTLLVTVQEGSAQTEDAIESVVDRLETRSEGGTDLTGITAQDIDGAAFVGQALPEGASALTAKVQVLLDRAGVSPGVIDGFSGGMSETAIMAFEARAGFAVDGLMDNEVWAALGGLDSTAITTVHVIGAEDIAGLSAGPLPTDYAALAELDRIGFTS